MTPAVKILLLSVLLTYPNTISAQSAGRVQYLGGTLASLQPRVEGAIRITDEGFTFVSRRAILRIPFEDINLVEYGQSVGRRYILAILISPVFLLCKTRAHFVTLGYRDETGQNAMVLRVDKRDIRSTLAALEARTGLRVRYLDDEARGFGPG